MKPLQAGTATITGIDRDAGTITVSSKSEEPSGDYIFREDDFPDPPPGMLFHPVPWIPTVTLSDPSQAAHFEVGMSIQASPLTRWQASVLRVRHALARPFQWLADRIRGYSLQEYYDE